MSQNQVKCGFNYINITLDGNNIIFTKTFNLLKMKRLLSVAIFIIGFTQAQVGVGTANPISSLHVDSSKNNPIGTFPSTTEQRDDVSITAISGSAAIGIGTVAPTQSLDVVNGNIRVRGIASSTTGGSDRLVVADSNGVLRAASGTAFSTSDSGNRVFRSQGGTTLNASTGWVNNVFTTLILNSAYDPLSTYDASTGEFTVPSDGLYLIYGIVSFNLPSTGSGTFDGTGGVAYSTISIDNGRIASSTVPILRGIKTPNANNTMVLFCSSTVWLKVGQKVTYKFLTYGTPNMVGNLSDLTIDRNACKLEISKLL